MERNIERLQFISQGNTAEQQITSIHHALDVGAKWIQLRFKNQDEKTVRIVAEQVKSLCIQYSAKCIINDWISVAQHVGADGVHLGLQDIDISTARSQLGMGAIIGGTANTIVEVRQRISEGCDYIGLGPYAYTSTKERLSPILGPAGYLTLLSQLEYSNIPVIAVGGIKTADLLSLKSTGVYGVALSTELLNVDFAQAAQMKQILSQFKAHNDVAHSR
ncbi:thiamine phosphate synthase [Sphingobacterium pedocola]|uniref:Thiamine-phosphate synthase n=1 Tax=Sphingobacterium pedocola TaxID=2082722 RepID=A0ABR9T6S7_9SPHI|nr:thiamine phosphate synthase [Sphingobacterium pedocola]MBE8721053.1 thiamine phosphate synthase [Sphingobacterium pedocola]